MTGSRQLMANLSMARRPRFAVQGEQYPAEVSFRLDVLVRLNHLFERKRPIDPRFDVVLRRAEELIPTCSVQEVFGMAEGLLILPP